MPYAYLFLLLVRSFQVCDEKDCYVSKTIDQDGEPVSGVTSCEHWVLDLTNMTINDVPSSEATTNIVIAVVSGQFYLALPGQEVEIDWGNIYQLEYVAMHTWDEVLFMTEYYYFFLLILFLFRNRVNMFKSSACVSLKISDSYTCSLNKYTSIRRRCSDTTALILPSCLSGNSSRLPDTWL